MDKAMGLEYVLKNVGDLTANPKNARTHNKKQIEKIMKSITEFGFISPIIIDGKGILVAGHGRLQAAKHLKLEKVPCLIADHLSDVQLRAYMLADNRIQLDSGWDEDLLKIELNALALEDIDLSITGFDVDQVGGFLRNINPTDKNAEWKQGMPEFSDLEPCHRKLIVSFDDEESVQAFAKLLKQEITSKTKGLWFPKKEKRDLEGKAWE